MKMSITMLSMIPCVSRTRNRRLNVAAVNSPVLSCGIQALGQRYVINPSFAPSVRESIFLSLSLTWIPSSDKNSVYLDKTIWSQDYKTFFMLISTVHEIYPAHNVKMPTIVGILTFISRINMPPICVY